MATDPDGPPGEAEGLPDLLGGDVARAVGANYHLSAANHSLDHWVNYDPLLAESEIAFLAANGINTIRTFLNFDFYEHDAESFLEDLYHYALQLAAHRVLFLAVLFDSFGSEPSGDPVADAASPTWIRSPGTAALTAPDFPARAAAYIADVVETVNQAIQDSGEPGIWWIADLWNEPVVATVTHSRLAALLATTRAQPNPPRTTVGFVDSALNGDLLAELPDPAALSILSGHPYGMFAEVITQKVQEAVALGDLYGGRPVFVSEVGLPGLFQFYGNVLQWLARAGVGFTLWEAFLGNDQFKNLTGLFYPEPIADGMVTVRSTTAVNALWALAMARDPAFAPPYLAREKELGPGYVSLGPANGDLSTGAYHALLADYPAHYGSADFPTLSIGDPGTGTLYSKLMMWTFLSLNKVVTVDAATAASVLQNLIMLREEYDLGNLAQAEAALFELFDLAAQIMTENGLGEPPNYDPAVLHSRVETTLNPDGISFDARFETVVFDVENGPLTPRFFVHDVAAGNVFELPLTAIPGTTAHFFAAAGIPLTNGGSYEFGVFVTDLAGGHSLQILPVTLP
ncbi:MAG: hypothetical protein AB1726_03715 [Planctomycetota bacterium]